MRQWLYDFLMRLSTWLKPSAPVEPVSTARPQIYAQGLWDQDAKLPLDFTVGDLVKEMTWDETPISTKSKLNPFR